MNKQMAYEMDALRLRSIMVLRGHNIGTLAAKTGISRATLSSMLREKKPTYRTMRKVAAELHLSPAECTVCFFAQNLHNT